jgi:hypothetical protein
MNHNPYFYERLANDRLSELRAEGLRSQSLAQAGLNSSRQFHFSDLRPLFHRLKQRLAHGSAPLLAESGALSRPAAGEANCG